MSVLHCEWQNKSRNASVAQSYNIQWIWITDLVISFYFYALTQYLQWNHKEHGMCGWALSKHQQSMSKINPHTASEQKIKYSISFPKRKQTEWDQLSVFASFVCARVHCSSQCFPISNRKLQ